MSTIKGTSGDDYLIAGSTILRGNTDADPAAEFEIQLDGVGLDLTDGDFFL